MDKAQPDYIQLLKRRHEQRVADRGVWNDHFEDVATYISPRRLGFVGIRTPGEKRLSRLYDSTGIQANQLLASGLHGMATNPASKWFTLRILGERIDQPDGKSTDINEIPHIRKWTSDVEHLLWQRLYQPGTNFASSLDESYLDLGAFGTAIIFAGQKDDGSLLFQCRTLAECLIDENADGFVDTVDRKFEMTVRQMVQLASKALSEDIRWDLPKRIHDLADAGKYDDKIWVIHSVHPREEYNPDSKLDQKDMPYRSVYFTTEDAHVLQEGGFPEFPYLVPRWSKVPGEVYGRSPGMTALPDVKMLQAKELTYIKALQKNADPPMWLRDDGVVGATRSVPGGINYWRGDPNQGVMMMPTNIQGLSALVESQQMLRDRIRNIFHVDVLQMVDQREMTLGEARMRMMERMRLMGPVVGRLEAELLGPLIARVIGILSRQSLLPPAPEEIQDKEYSVEFVSPLATAQKQEEMGGIMAALQPLSVLGPEIAMKALSRKVNLDRFVDHLWDINHLDPDLLNTDEEIAAQDQQEQGMMAAQMMQQGGVPAADMMQKGAGAVKQLADAQASGGVDINQIAQGAGQVLQMPQMRKALAQAQGGGQGGGM